MQIQTTKATRVLVQRDGRTLSTWTLIADGANMVAVRDGVIFSSGRAFGKMEQLRRMTEPVTWTDSELRLGSGRYRVVSRLASGEFVVEAVE